MNKLEYDLKKLGKRTIWMLLTALIIAIIFIFINPWYFLIFVGSGVMGFIMGSYVIMTFIPEDQAQFLQDIKDMMDKQRLNDLNNN